MLTGIRDRVHSHWRLALSDRQLALTQTLAGNVRTTGAGLAVRLPFNQATALIENITAQEDMVPVRLYGHPWVVTGSWPMITPCFRVTAVDDTGVHHEGEPGDAKRVPLHPGGHRHVPVLAPGSPGGNTATCNRQHPLGSGLGRHRGPRSLTRPRRNHRPPSEQSTY